MVAAQDFQKPSATEQLLNRIFGFVVGMGVGPSYCYLLQVRGRKTGKLYSVPVNLTQMDGKRLLVAPRGRTQWVRNAEASGEITLKRGGFRQSFHLRAIEGADKLPILKKYLDDYRSAVQRYFTIPAGSPAQAFLQVADYYPVFELTEA